ncbi:MAG: dTDP-4-dehydrorhamnose reductase [Candidatus Bathyarchaeia archaeon]
MKKLLVTGESGLLGNMIVKLVSDQVVIPCHYTRPLNADSLKMDITDENEVSALFKQLKPDVVIHTASQTNVDKCEIQKEEAWKTNVEGARNIAVACGKENIKLIYISTDYVFDGNKGYYKEEDETNPINYYGLTKLEGEKEVVRHCQNYVILRTSVIYGWHPWKLNFATWVITQLKQGKAISVVDDHYNTPTLADNLAQVCLEVAHKKLNGIYHASGSERISRFEFAKKIAKFFNLDLHLLKPIKMIQLTSWIAKRPLDSSLDTSKLQKRLKTKLPNIDEGLEKMKESERP